VREEAKLAQQTAAYYELDPEFDWIKFVNEKLAHGRRKFFVADNRDELAGYIEARVVRHPQPEKARHRLIAIRRRRRPRNDSPLKPISWGVIEGCFVTQPCRRCGIGRLLADQAMRWFDTQNLVRVELAVLAHNDSGRRFWQELGFKPYRLLLAK